MRRDPLEVREATLRSMLAKAGLGLRLNEHLEGDGPTVFAHACKMGLEGIVSKRKDSAYRSGRSKDWLKFKNPDAQPRRSGAEIQTGVLLWRTTSTSHCSSRAWPPGTRYEHPNIRSDLSGAYLSGADSRQGGALGGGPPRGEPPQGGTSETLPAGKSTIATKAASTGLCVLCGSKTQNSNSAKTMIGRDAQED